MAENVGIITASGRTLDEVKAGIKIRMRSMVNSALDIGIDLMEAKEACRHGEWMPFLKEIGLSASTAANYMRIAKEVSADSRMAALPYTKILALLAAPPEEREELAEAAEDMSAAEIRQELERAKSEKAGLEQQLRATISGYQKKMDEVEKAAYKEGEKAAKEDAKKEILELGKDKSELIREINRIKETNYDLKQENIRLNNEVDDMANNPAETKLLNALIEIDDLKAKLLTAENNKVEVEVPPADYEQLKRNQQELLNAAADAEERANAAEAELERIQTGGDGGKMEKPIGIVLGQAMNAFFRECEMMPFNPAELQRDRYAVKHCIELIREWYTRMEEALESPVVAEASVV